MCLLRLALGDMTYSNTTQPNFGKVFGDERLLSDSVLHNSINIIIILESNYESFLVFGDETCSNLP